ncbi:MAG: hypothetical protein HRT58_22040 [Crocinitomicaceae bacterium]|nr:hypothetical protein [Flavobacteriales bacterium]NQZ38357.1 hypothetical protein [Crocinitomicaceae bacterium]
MMKKQFGLLLLLVLFGSSSNFVFSQRGGSNPSVTVVPTITHGTCFNPKGVVDYVVVVSSHWENEASMNSLQLNDDIPEVVYDHPDVSLTGTINDLDVGVYTFSGSVTALNSTGMWVSVPFSATIWVGIETIWTEKIDMVASPNSYSAKRNASIQTYGGIRSSNTVVTGNGWAEMNAQYGSTSDNRVFWLIGDYDPLGTFDPTSNTQYLEFFKGSGGNGIRLKHETSGGSYTFQTLSGDPDDKIRLVKNGTTLTIQKNDVSTTIFTLPTTYVGAMSIAVRTLAQDDGCLDVISSFPCAEPKIYAGLKYKIDGFYHTMTDGKIRFVFDQEYDTDDLKFTIYNHMDVLVKDQDDYPLLGTTNGDNYLTIDVSDDVHCIGRGFFYLELINSKKEKSYLRFFNDFSNPACLDATGGGNPPNE